MPLNLTELTVSSASTYSSTFWAQINSFSHSVSAQAAQFKQDKILMSEEINILNALDELSGHIRYAIIGDYARGIVSDTFTAYDRCHVVTDNAEMLIELPVILRSKLFKPKVSERTRRNSTRSYSNDEEVYMFPISSTKEQPVEEYSKESYLTPEEYATFVPEKYRNLSKRLVLYPDTESVNYSVPDLAKVIFGIKANGASVTVHVVENGAIENYINNSLKIANKETISANTIAFIDKTPFSIIESSIELAKGKKIDKSPSLTEENAKVRELIHQGWK